MSNFKEYVFKNLQKVIQKEVKKQEDSACFLLAYQPKFPLELQKKHLNKYDR